MAKTNLTKTAKVEVETKKGGKYSYRYTELADINEYVESINETYCQFIKRIDTDDYIFTQRFGENSPKEALQGCRVVQAPATSEYSNPAQEQGSALTYARRYSLLMAYGLATEDDDAQKLSKANIETLEEALNYKVNFKKHPNTTLGEIYGKDPGYIDWLFNGEKTDETIKKCIELIYKGEQPKEEYTNILGDITILLLQTNTDENKFYKHFGVENIEELTEEQRKQALEKLKEKQAKMPKKDVF